MLICCLAGLHTAQLEDDAIGPVVQAKVAGSPIKCPKTI